MVRGKGKKRVWNLSASNNTLQASDYAFLIAVEANTEERLVIDKQIEWQLFCEEHVSLQQETVVEIEIVTRASLIDLSSDTNSNPIVSSIQISIEDLYKKVQQLSQPKPARGITQNAPEPQKQHTQPPKPTFAFHSVEPQVIKPRKQTESTTATTSESKPDTAPTPAQAPPTQLSFEDIMARSRMQGESLNHLFGSMQARSAGHQPDRMQEEQAEPSMTQDTQRDEEPEQPASQEAQSAPIGQNVGNMNSYLQDAWQERLSQMGHGPDSGSPYAKLRSGKIKELPSDMTGNVPGPSGYQETPLTMPAMVASTSATGARELHGISEEMSTSNNHDNEELFVFPTTSSVQASPRLSNLQQERMSNTEDYMMSGSTPTTRSAKSSLLINKIFKHRRGNSDLTRSSAPSFQFGHGRETPEGARTPQSFNSSLFRRRPLSVKSLSDALVGSTRKRVDTGESSKARPSTATGGNATPVQSTTPSSFDRRRRHKAVRSLSDFNLFSMSQRRRRNDSTQSVPTLSIDANLPREGNGSQNMIAMKNDHPQLQNEAGITHQSKTGKDIARPTLLRASHSTPLSSTTINLSSAGGITLHAPSVADPSFTWTRSSNELDDHAFKIYKPSRNLFDIMLPREIQLNCFKALIESHQEEATQGCNDVQRIAAKRRGKAKAMRELVRLSAVSRNWQSLTLDGQLWSELDLSTATNVSDECVKRIIGFAGPFIKSINMRNMQHTSSQLLIDMSTPSTSVAEQRSQVNPRNIPGARQRAKTASRLPMMTISNTNLSLPSLTSLNLQGCRSISKDALHHTLVRLPQLRSLNISNLTEVANDTLLILGASLPRLLSLNISRCSNVTGDGLMNFIDAAQGSLYDQSLFKKGSKVIYTSIADVALDMRELRVAGLKDVESSLMNNLGRAMRSLRILDLSYASDLNDDAIAAFVRHPGPPLTSSKKELGNALGNEVSDDDLYGPFVALSARQAGESISYDDQHYRRVHQHLTHLILSSCRSLTDRTCTHLAHSVPQLRCLELANVGNSLRDTGLEKLLQTTPKIERIDVEGAAELGDKFIQALTPSEVYLESIGIFSSSGENANSLITSTRNTSERRSRTLSRLGRRALRRVRQDETEDAMANVEIEERPLPNPTVSDDQSQIPIEPPTGANLTHLIISHLSKIDPNVLVTLVRRCPKLIHLEVDDTRANDALLNEFVGLVKKRKTHGAYISLVDCRALSKSANAEVFASGQARPRKGKVGSEFSQFHYENRAGSKGTGSHGKASSTLQTVARSALNSENAESSGTTEETNTNAQSSNKNSSSSDECDDSLVVVKTFWAWQAVDVRNRIRKRAEARRAAMMAKLNGKQGGSGAMGKFDGSLRSATGKVRDPLAAALHFISSGGLTEDDELEEGGSGRWSRMTTGILGPNDEGEDPRGCSVM
ncbi:uncharacterized protein FA14DRAFT_172625 [Meira miltonrushii]|uniref:RNI-like protein n=1 Tax=Meira miltonrushii TaxID=1280837 RepID=A0A316VET2_9BASI|nr:uncharacterized protein FA14DRAFT_172625 [Meira miltonrushii]PWN36040.1 hypothetical protein FA14DRAFT_172625 [Meira miltonrushii]